uniref:Uncharacterized protein n=1 Tax=Ixodes ricinus TaxID=34613 RepID=A0A0K8RMJ5_IXORI
MKSGRRFTPCRCRVLLEPACRRCAITPIGFFSLAKTKNIYIIRRVLKNAIFFFKFSRGFCFVVVYGTDKINKEMQH